MPRKSEEVDPRSIHRTQLYNTLSVTARAATHESGQSDVKLPQDVESASRRSAMSGVNHGMMRLWRSVRDLVYGWQNNLSWELTSPFTIGVGPITTIIPFNNENIKGSGAYTTASGWHFSPPPKYSGNYRVSAFIEFLSGALQNLDAARLEIWLTSQGVTRRWRVLDKQYFEYGNVDDDDYLEKIVLGNSCIVPVCCGEVMTVRLYTRNTGMLVMADMASLYGYVDVNYLGCKGELVDPTAQLYTMPDTL